MSEDEKGQIIEEKINHLVDQLDIQDCKLSCFKKSRISNIEAILLAYLAFWIFILSGPRSSYHEYPIYEGLDKIISETHLIMLLSVIFLMMFIGCILGNKILRLHALMLSVITWAVIASSFFQTDPESIRASVIILSGAASYQFVQLMRERRRYL